MLHAEVFKRTLEQASVRELRAVRGGGGGLVLPYMGYIGYLKGMVFESTDDQYRELNALLSSSS